MNASSSDKDVLVERLAKLLGFEDGAGDVMEHLLSIESKEDLLHYLSQLLGESNKDILSFVQDVDQFQRGEPLSSSTAQPSDAADSKPPASTTTTAAERSRAAPPAAKPKTNQQPKTKPKTKTKSVPARSKPSVTSSAAKKQPIPQDGTSAAGQDSSRTPPTTSLSVVDKSRQKPQPSKTTLPEPNRVPPPPPPKKSNPPRGKASVVCGCFGTRHRPLTNCLYCGRISCEREGYDFCPFCGVLVEQVTRGDSNNPTRQDKAWEHKERLLRFDREFARRTVVLDDHVDHPGSSSSQQLWLTEEERAEARAAESQRRQDMHSRARQKLNISFT